MLIYTPAFVILDIILPETMMPLTMGDAIVVEGEGRLPAQSSGTTAISLCCKPNFEGFHWTEVVTRLCAGTMHRDEFDPDQVNASRQQVTKALT